IPCRDLSSPELVAILAYPEKKRLAVRPAWPTPDAGDLRASQQPQLVSWPYRQVPWLDWARGISISPPAFSLRFLHFVSLPSLGGRPRPSQPDQAYVSAAAGHRRCFARGHRGVAWLERRPTDRRHETDAEQLASGDTEPGSSRWSKCLQEPWLTWSWPQ